MQIEPSTHSATSYSMLDGHRIAVMPSTHADSQGAGHSRPVNSGKLFVLQPFGGLLHRPVDEVVEDRDPVAERAALHAEGNAAVHAARALLGDGGVGLGS